MAYGSWQQSSHRGRHVRRSTLAVVVIGWWLLLGGAIVWLVPESPASASPRPAAIAAGQPDRIYLPAMASLPIPAERVGFDMFWRGMRESDEETMDEAFKISEWIRVSHGQPVRVLQVEGEAIEIELLDGPHVGRHAWLKASTLSSRH